MFCITKSPLVWAVLSLRFRGSRRVAVARRLHSKVSSLPILSGWGSPGGGRTVGGMGWATGEVGGNHSACPSADCLPGGIGKKTGWGEVGKGRWAPQSRCRKREHTSEGWWRGWSGEATPPASTFFLVSWLSPRKNCILPLDTDAMSLRV